MASTSAGYLGILNDDGMSSFTAYTAGAVSGGNWVTAGSDATAATLSLSGGAVTFTADMITVTQGGSGTTRPVGLALQNTGSNQPVAIIRRGIVILPANDDVTAGGNVAASAATNGESCVADAATGSPNFNTNDVIGIALTEAASGTNNFAVVQLNL